MPPLTRRPLTEQERNLWILRGIGLGALLLFGGVAVALYFGSELPPAQLRSYYTSTSGYAPPPRPGAHPVGTVPRGALTLKTVVEAAPVPENGRAPHAPIPPAAARLRNPLATDPETLALGRRAYQVNCAMCHGQPGEGIGPVGERYVPRPPDLAEHVAAHSDGELFSVISDGIRSTPTPEAAQYLPQQWHAFRAEVPPRDRWGIVTYLRQTFGRGGRGMH